MIKLVIIGNYFTIDTAQKKKRMKSAINKELIEIQAMEYNSMQNKFEDLYCPVCGEQVTFVRASSGARQRVAHFKHISGKKSQECELYVPFSGGYYAVSPRKIQSAGENLALLVNIKDNFFQFYIGISFSEENLSYYESEKTELKISYVSEGRNKTETRLVNREHFSPNHMEKIPLQSDSKNVTIIFNDKSKVISCAEGMTYYRVSEMLSDDTSIWARKIEKNSLIKSLYVGEQYVLIVPKHAVLREIYHVKKQIRTLPIYDVYLVEISEYNDNAVNVCKQQGYNLKDVREQFDILWPPVKNNNGIYEVNSGKLYAISNIELEYKENISCDKMILEEGVYKIDFNNVLLISSETKEFTYMAVKTQKLPCKPLQVKTVIAQEITADNDQYYWFNSKGVQRLSIGQKIKLLPHNLVQQNCKNYPLQRYRCKYEDVKHVDWISDALKYYKAIEKFTSEDIIYNGQNPYVWQYLRKIKNSGYINCYIKRRILEDTDD